MAVSMNKERKTKKYLENRRELLAVKNVMGEINSIERFRGGDEENLL